MGGQDTFGPCQYFGLHRVPDPFSDPVWKYSKELLQEPGHHGRLTLPNAQSESFVHHSFVNQGPYGRSQCSVLKHFVGRLCPDQAFAPV
jgi:hypothetical protein